MKDALLTQVLKLNLLGFPAFFDSVQLDMRAKGVLDDLATLLGSAALLQHTKLIHRFTQIVDDRQRPLLQLVIGLCLKNQLVLDYHYSAVTAGDLELRILEDRQRLVNACKNLPTMTTAAAIEFSQKVFEACLDCASEDPQQDLSRRLSTLLGVRTKSLVGTLSDQPWEHQLPLISRYEWHPEKLMVRALLHREKRGFSIHFLKRESLPPILHSAHRLPMPECPSDLDTADLLDRSVRTKSPLNLVIRVGTRPGSSKIEVADFVELAVVAATANMPIYGRFENAGKPDFEDRPDASRAAPAQPL